MHNEEQLEALANVRIKTIRNTLRNEGWKSLHGACRGWACRGGNRNSLRAGHLTLGGYDGGGIRRGLVDGLLGEQSFHLLSLRLRLLCLCLRLQGLCL